MTCMHPSCTRKEDFVSHTYTNSTGNYHVKPQAFIRNSSSLDEILEEATTPLEVQKRTPKRSTTRIAKQREVKTWPGESKGEEAA